MLKSQENSIGAWAFLIGVIIAFVIGLSTSLLSFPSIMAHSAKIYGVLFILGIIIGSVINGGKDSQTFLWTGTILVVVSKFGAESVSGSLIGIGLGNAVTSTFSAFLALFVPATIIVALKTVFSIAKV